MAITDLNTLLENLKPVLDPEEYGFYTVDGNFNDYLDLSPLAAFVEPEGLSLVLTVSQAQNLGLRIEAKFRRIMLSVYSSLEAIGLTAEVAKALAQEGISANVIAAYHHDHVFVPVDKAHQAMRILNSEAFKNTSK